MPITESHVKNKPPIVAMQEMIGGDVNYNPQVIHHTQNIINNNSQGDINNPVEDFSEVSKNAYESGRKALQALGIFVLILVLNGLIGLAFGLLNHKTIIRIYMIIKLILTNHLTGLTIILFP